MVQITQKPVVLTPALRAKVLAATHKKPADGSTHWNCRQLGATLGISKNIVRRVWKEAGLKPHRLERYVASTIPTSSGRHHWLISQRAEARDVLGEHLDLRLHFTADVLIMAEPG